MWIKNTKGRPDAMLTIALIAFAVVVFNVILATLGTLTVAGVSFTFVAMDSGTMAAFLAPTLSAYVGRRWTTAAYSTDETDPPPETGNTTIIVQQGDGSVDVPDDFEPTGER